MATLLRPNSPPETVHPPAKHKGRWRLESLQTLIGGDIETWILEDGKMLVWDEDARRKRLPINDVASQMMGMWVRGTVLVVARPEVVD